jgi:hypothetical protein
VRDGKGGHDRVTVLPENPILPLQEHLGGAMLSTRPTPARDSAVCRCRTRWRPRPPPQL